MRLMECVRLRVKDVDFGRNEILIRDGKGAKDRVTMLPAALAGALRDQLARRRMVYEDDLRDGKAEVWLPYALAKKYRIKTAWGTDTLFDAKVAATQGSALTKMVRWYTPAEVLRMATSVNAELLALSGPRSPYSGVLGVVKEGALADLLLVDGDPLLNIQLIDDPARNLLVIMKDGNVVKNTLRL
jgi:imidazolonepropionase-like amidohydrolase